MASEVELRDLKALTQQSPSASNINGGVNLRMLKMFDCVHRREKCTSDREREVFKCSSAVLVRHDGQEPVPTTTIRIWTENGTCDQGEENKK